MLYLAFDAKRSTLHHNIGKKTIGVTRSIAVPFQNMMRYAGRSHMGFDIERIANITINRISHGRRNPPPEWPNLNIRLGTPGPDGVDRSVTAPC